METYGKVLLFAMPAFLLLVVLEMLYAQWKHNHKMPTMDIISSLFSGITNVVKDVLNLSIGIISYPFLLKYCQVFTVTNSLLLYLITFIVLDFNGYWVHRWSHKINFLWNRHLIHHSSEEFNLACALRQSVSTIVQLFTILLLPAAFFGVPPMIVAVIAPLHLFAQFWYHTRFINRMGWVENVLVTPSHHRVHHAINKEYMDKNFAQIFIVWDKWFGTFQEELPHVPAVFGITRPVRTWNPIKINFQHLWLLFKDAWRTQKLADKIKVFFMPTGWRPADVEQSYPVYKIEDVYDFEKYQKHTTTLMRTWLWACLLLMLGILVYFFYNIAQLNAMSPWAIYAYGFYIIVTIYAITETMDGSTMQSRIASLIQLVFFAFCLTQFNNWFGGNAVVTTMAYTQLFVSVAGSWVFLKGSKVITSPINP